MVHPQCTASDRKLALFVIDDVIEFVPSHAESYMREFAGLLLQSVSDDDFGVQQAAAYGVGAAAKSLGNTLGDFAGAASDALVASIQANPQDSEDGKRAFDNCVAAVGKLVRWCHDCIDVGRYVEGWLSLLPLETDHIEARGTVRDLCSILDSNAALVVGSQFERLAATFVALANAVRAESCDEATAQLVRQVVGNTAAALPDDAVRAAFESLPAELRDALRSS